MRLYLVRHASPRSLGASEWAKALPDDDNALSDLGAREAAALARTFSSIAREGKCVVVSSQLRRARETAEPIAASLGVDVVYDQRLNELTLNLSPGATDKDSREVQLAALRSPHIAIDTAERVADHRLRVEEWFSELCATQAGDGTCIAVSHGGTMEHILATIFGSPVENMQRYHVGCGCAHFHCLSRFEPAPDWRVWRVDYLNRAAQEA